MFKLPNFFVVGVPKAGTTALYHHLREHPDIFMPSVKEPSFFSERVQDDGSAMTWERYQSLFAEAGAESTVGEASPDYFHSEKAPQRIADYNLDARIVVILRQPVERSYSHFLMLQNSGITRFSSFAEATEETIKHLKQGKPPPYGSGHRQSFYAGALAHYHSFFPSEQILVLKHEQYRRAPQDVLKAVYDHLDVASDYVARSLDEKYNVGSGQPKSRLVQDLASRTTF